MASEYGRELVTLIPTDDQVDNARRDACAAANHPPHAGCFNPWMNKTFCPCGAARYPGNLRILRAPGTASLPRAPWFGGVS